MNRLIEWVEKREDGTKRRARISFFARTIKWQFQIDKEKWNYNEIPSLEDWERLLDEVQRRYRRRNVSWKDVELTEQMMKEAKKQLLPRKTDEK